jgi:hypothetical protein
MISLLICLIIAGLALIIFPTLRTYLVFFFLVLPIGIIMLVIQTVNFLLNYYFKRIIKCLKRKR